MVWKLTSDRPVYLQLADELETRIISGEYPLASKLPSVRELAAEATVNPNTMQKAMTELERRGLAFTNRTAGRFVTDDLQVIASRRNELLSEDAEEFLKKAKRLGVSKDEVLKLFLDINDKTKG